MRELVRLRLASALALHACLAVVLISTTGCPGAQPVTDARAATTPGHAPDPPRSRSRADVRTAVDVRYYDIVGRSVQDLLVAMQRGGPQWNGRRFFGLTNTSLQYGYRHSAGPAGCVTREVSVLVEVTVTLPRWLKPPGTPYDLDRDWRAFERALRGHEDGHRRLAEEEAATLSSELGRMRATTCEILDSDAGRLADEVRTRYGRRHESYDRQTQHGRTQGAAWPRE